MAANQEIELKFELEGDERGSNRLRDELVRRYGPGKTATLTSTYFDTVDFSLRDAAVSLRIREADGRRTQTVKARPAQSNGLFARSEWEHEVAGDQPDLKATGDSPLADILDEDDARRGLAPAFRSWVERTTWDVVQDEGAFELALDEGKIEADGRTAPIHELELELKSGRPSGLLTLAKSLDAVSPLRLGGRSKADRGYQLLEKRDRTAVAAHPAVLTRSMTVAAAFRTISLGCMSHFLQNEPLLIGTRSQEALHQARVALRRLRSALSLFKPVIEDEAYPTLKLRLKALTQALGHARNLDVLIASLDHQGESTGQDSLALTAQLRADREDAYDAAIAALTAPEARRLMLDLMVWIEVGAWCEAPDSQAAEQPLAPFAVKALDQRRRKLERLGKGLKRQDAETRHQVRIEAKKLRYAAEFFLPLFDGKARRQRAHAYLDALKTVQEDLGDLNDLAQAQLLTEQLATRAAGTKSGARTRGELIFAAGMEAGRRQAMTAKAVKAAARSFGRFQKAEPFWG